MLGCNFHCPFCQNWISSQVLRDNQAVAHPREVTAEQLVALAVQHQTPVIVSTYNEPLITVDWAVEIFKLAKAENIACGMVSNGNGTPEVLEFIRPYVDLYKVDLKCFSDRSYRRLGGVLANVLDTIRRAVKMGFWVEVVTLVVPGFNDTDDELSGIAGFLADVSTDIPWHVTAFHPDYQMTDRGRTPAETLARARELGLAAGLGFVYAGNLPGRLAHAEDTVCPGCGDTLIRRSGFRVEGNRMSGSTCPGCGRSIPGVWEPTPPRSGRSWGMPRPV
jgi:pyruvate formate lyase activating enzyme